MNSSGDMDPLDARLREESLEVEDGGFTVRVVELLPRRRRAWLSPALLVGATAAGSVLAVWWVPWGSLPALDVPAWFPPDPQVLWPWAFALAVSGSLGWSALTMLRWED